jgi:AraC-like DNA-binding protein
MIQKSGLEIRHKNMTIQPELVAAIRAASFVERLFDRIPEVVFFIKDTAARYVMVNRTLVERCGRKHKNELIGRTAAEVFPDSLADRFFEQDLRVLRTGLPIQQNLELHLYPTRLEGWCLTDKEVLTDSNGQVIGLSGVSRDLHTTEESAIAFGELAGALDSVRANPGGPMTVEDMARVAELSVYQLNRRLGLLFGITASQFIIKTRIDQASKLLRTTDDAIAGIADRCGYFDQSAFSRVFRRAVGLTPRQYRARHREYG